MTSNGSRRSLGRYHVLALAGLLMLLGAVWLVPLASAHNSLITASGHCDSSVSYTTTAWAGPTTASRTNTSSPLAPRRISRHEHDDDPDAVSARAEFGERSLDRTRERPSAGDR